MAASHLLVLNVFPFNLVLRYRSIASSCDLDESPCLSQQLPFGPTNIRLTEILGYKASPLPVPSSSFRRFPMVRRSTSTWNTYSTLYPFKCVLRNKFFAITSAVLYFSRISSVLCSRAPMASQRAEPDEKGMPLREYEYSIHIQYIECLLLVVLLVHNLKQ